jgi:hypothetical protein
MAKGVEFPNAALIRDAGPSTWSTGAPPRPETEKIERHERSERNSSCFLRRHDAVA